MSFGYFTQAGATLAPPERKVNQQKGNFNIITSPLPAGNSIEPKFSLNQPTWCTPNFPKNSRPV